MKTEESRFLLEELIDEISGPAVGITNKIIA